MLLKSSYYFDQSIRKQMQFTGCVYCKQWKTNAPFLNMCNLCNYAQYLQAQSNMSPSLRNLPTYSASNHNAHFSLSNMYSYVHWLNIMIQAGIGAVSCPGCFCCDLFLRFVRHRQLLTRSLYSSIFSRTSRQPAVNHHTTG